MAIRNRLPGGIVGTAVIAFLIVGLIYGTIGLIPSRQPNVIFILVDTLRADYLGCYGFEGDVSPHIDHFASTSVQFTRCSSQSPWTPPSIGSCFASRYPYPVPLEGGAFRISVLPEKHETLAESFQDSRYETRAFVENGLLIPQNGFSQGFDVYAQKRSAKDSFKAFDKFLEWHQERTEPEKPYFAYIHVMDVHGPYRYLDENFDAIKNSPSLGPPRQLTGQEIEDRPKPIATFIPWADGERGKERRSWRAAYAAGIRLFDRKFGKFLKKLDDLGISEDTIIVFTSDHGEQLLDNGGWGHGHTLNNYQTNVPLIMRFPDGQYSGTTVDSLVGLIDITPTIADACSLDVSKATHEGRTLLPGIQGGQLTASPAFATSIIGDPYIFSVRSQDHLLVWDGRSDHHELFDVSQPSWLRKNLASQSPEQFQLLKGKLDAHVSVLKQQEPAMTSMPMPEHMHDHVRALGYIK